MNELFIRGVTIDWSRIGRYSYLREKKWVKKYISQL